jgi:hypothetical protein
MPTFKLPHLLMVVTAYDDDGHRSDEHASEPYALLRRARFPPLSITGRHVAET